MNNGSSAGRDAVRDGAGSDSTASNQGTFGRVAGASRTFVGVDRTVSSLATPPTDSGSAAGVAELPAADATAAPAVVEFG
jgi:hypothetical protein